MGSAMCRDSKVFTRTALALALNGQWNDLR